MKRYKASLDNTAKGVTLIVLLLLAFVAMQLYGQRTAFSMIGLLVLIIVLLTTFLFKPSYYYVDNKGIHIKRPINEVVIPFSALTSVDRKLYGELGAGLRLFGSGGFLGYLGTFYYSSLGRVSMLCTNKNNMILIVTDKKKMIISPDEPEEFINNLNIARTA